MTDNWQFCLTWPSKGWVALLEDDNFWSPSHLANAEVTLATTPDAVLFHCAHLETFVGDPKEPARTREVHAPWAGAHAPPSVIEVLMDALGGGHINASSVVVRRDAVNRVPPFDPRFLMGMDTLMWARVAMEGRVAYSDSVGVTYSYHGQNVSHYEMCSRRAPVQARLARSLLLKESTRRGFMKPEEVRKWLLESPVESCANALIVLGSQPAARWQRELVPDILRERPELARASRHLALTRVAGQWTLRHTLNIDRALRTIRTLEVAGRGVGALSTRSKLLRTFRKCSLQIGRTGT